MCLEGGGSSCLDRLKAFPGPEPSKYPPHMWLEVTLLAILAIVGIGLLIWYTRLAGKKRLVVFVIALLCIVAAADGLAQLPNRIEVWQADNPRDGVL